MEKQGKPVILFRRGVDLGDQDEFEIAKRYFEVYEHRTEIPFRRLVIGRYSVLPFYKELEWDIQNNSQSRMINSFRQHQFIADMREWTAVLGDMTPKLYERLEDLPEEGPFVLKGQTNSKKHLWNTHMFAKTKREAIEVASRLHEDSLIGSQQVYAREYVELEQMLVGLNGLPITEEYRFFVVNGKVITGAYYWSSHVADLGDYVPSEKNVPTSFLEEAIRRIGDRANFYTLDVAATAKGGWVVIEINDGQMAGLSENCPDEFYSKLRESFGA